MTVIHNLIQSGFIKVGTWVGVHVHSPGRVSQMVVHEITSSDHIICEHVQTCVRYKVPPGLIQEVDGMQLSRYLSQADLDAQGRKRNQRKRGRKPKVRP